MKSKNKYVYASFVGDRLFDKITEVEKATANALSLQDELLLMRVMAGDAIRLYDKAMEGCERLEDPGARSRVLALASGMVVEALNNVRDMAAVEYKLRCDQGMINVNVLGDVAMQVVNLFDSQLRIHEDKFREAGVDVQELANSMSEAIQDMVMIPSNAVRGTRVTPDQEVAQMDATVPLVPAAQPQLMAR